MGGLVWDEGVGLVDVVKVGVVVGVVKKVEWGLVRYRVESWICGFDGRVEMLVDEGEEGEVGDSVEDGGRVGCVDVGEGNEVVFREEERVVKDVVVEGDEVEDVVVDVGFGWLVMDVEGVGVEDVVELKKVRFNGRGKVGLGRRGGKV